MHLSKINPLKNFPFLLLLIFLASCQSATQNNNAVATTDTDQSFSTFEGRFLNAYWQQYPTGSIFNGYGKYYEKLVTPDSAAFADNVRFSKAWLNSLNGLKFDALNSNNKISFNIIKNQLESDAWYITVFKSQEWDPSMYNISAACDYIINQPYAPLDERLKILTKYLQHTDTYYKAAFANLHEPTKEHLEMAIMQNQGGLDVFGKSLTDSINVSHLFADEKMTLLKNIDMTKKAMMDYVSALKKIDADKNYTFRNFRIGKQLFTEKFKYDLATDLTPEQMYDIAMRDKVFYKHKMMVIADSVWTKYYPTQPKPKDSLEVVKLVLDKVQLDHATPKSFFDSLTSQVYQLKKFIVDKQLFDFDTTSPAIIVRYMPIYARGLASASAEFTPPYQKQGNTYYNIDDLTLYAPEKAESALKETNNPSSQILSIHEAVPGHCLQGIYNNKKSPDVLRSVFQNGAMIEGWACYTEQMMVEEGWGNHSAEIEMMLCKWKLRELANVIVDYDVQVLNKSKEDIYKILVDDCFQTSAQAEEKYHRATISQVQLCSYYTGSTAILALRDDYKKKLGADYSLKKFHEAFLSFGSSPVKYIREMMLK